MAAHIRLKKNALADPQCVPGLFEVGCSDEEERIRDAALTLLRKQILVKGSKQWKGQPEEIRSAFKSRLLEVVLTEPSSLLRLSFVRLIASIGHAELPASAWPDLLPWIFTLSTSRLSAHCETALQVIYHLLDTLVELPAADAGSTNVPQLLELLGKLVQDSDSLDVSVWAVRTLGKLSEWTGEGNSAEVTTFQALIPSMLAVLARALEAGDKASARSCFDVLEGLTLSESSLLNTHLGTLLEFLLTSAGNAGVDSSLRVSCLDCVLWIVKFKKSKITSLVGSVVASVVSLGVEGSSDTDGAVSTAAFTILDTLANAYPSTQVLPPLLDQVQTLSSSTEGRKAGVTALGVVVGGCSGAINLEILWSFIEMTLKDNNVEVRKAALETLAQLADALGQDCSKQHAMLMPILSNLVADLDTLAPAIVALDALLETLDGSIEPYLPSLMDALLSLLDSSEKAAVVGAIGSAAFAAKEAFQPYLDSAMQRLLPFLASSDDGDAMDLRLVTQETIGVVARAVGKDSFRPLYAPTLQIAIAALDLPGITPKEASYSYFASLAEAYREEFAEVLPSIMPSLLEAVQRDEDTAMLGSHSIDLQSALAADAEEEDGDFQDEGDSDFEDVDSDSDDGSDLDEAEEALFSAATALASLKETAIDALGQIFASVGAPFIPYVESSLASLLANFKPHWHSGIRRASAVAALHFLTTANSMVGGPQWKKGESSPLHADVSAIVSAVLPPILTLLKDEEDKEVVDDSLNGLSDALMVVGPSLLDVSHLKLVYERVEEVLTRKAPCKVDDEGEDDESVDGDGSEADTDLLATACDLLGTLATVLGSRFADASAVFVPLMAQQAGFDIPDDLRSSALGSIAEVALGLAGGITPFTEQLFTILVQALNDPDAVVEVKTNAAFALGTLVASSDQDLSSQFGVVLTGLHPLFNVEGKASESATDNACGAVARMLLKNASTIPLEEVLPVYLKALPLKRDFAESEPVMASLISLIRAENPVALSHLDSILAIFQHALSSVQDGYYPEFDGAQLTEQTKDDVVKLLRDLNGSLAEQLSAAGLSSYVV